MIADDSPGHAHRGRGAAPLQTTVRAQCADRIIAQFVSMVAARGYSQTKVSELTASTAAASEFLAKRPRKAARRPRSVDHGPLAARHVGLPFPAA